MGDFQRRGWRYLGASPQDMCRALGDLMTNHPLFEVRVLLVLIVEYAFSEPPSHVPFPADFDQIMWLRWLDLVVDDDDVSEAVEGALKQTDIGRVGATFWDYGDVSCPFVVVWVHPVGQAFGVVFLSQVDERQLNLDMQRIVIGPDMGLRVGENEDPWPTGKPPVPVVDEETLLPTDQIQTRNTLPPLYRVFLMAGTPHFPTHLRKFTERSPGTPPYELHGLRLFKHAAGAAVPVVFTDYTGCSVCRFAPPSNLLTATEYRYLCSST